MDIEKLKQAVEAVKSTNEAMVMTMNYIERLEGRVDGLIAQIREKDAELQRLSNLLWQNNIDFQIKAGGDHGNH